MSLYNKHRPNSFAELKGDYSYIQELISRDDHPHAFLFQGLQGSGKTTTARIIAKELGADDMDIVEKNSADFNGVDDIRALIPTMYVSPFGKSRVFILDECHKLSTEAQHALLKPLEEPPKNVYFILCTTETTKILKTIKDRCTIIQFGGLTEDDLFDIVNDVAKKESFKLSRDVKEAIASAADGSARRALVLLEQVAHLDEGEQLRALRSGTTEDASVIDLCRALFSRSTWGDIKDMLGKLKEQKEDPEKLRRAILGYGQAILLKKYDDIVLRVMSLFLEPVYDSGFPGLVVACARASDLATCGSL
jgi:DNA polymerase-3 subunit gamma/tau